MNKLIIACIPKSSVRAILPSQSEKIYGICALINASCLGNGNPRTFVCGVNPENPVLWEIVAKIKPAVFDFLDLTLKLKTSVISDRESVVIGKFLLNFCANERLLGSNLLVLTEQGEMAEFLAVIVSGQERQIDSKIALKTFKNVTAGEMFIFNFETKSATKVVI